MRTAISSASAMNYSAVVETKSSEFIFDCGVHRLVSGELAEAHCSHRCGCQVSSVNGKQQCGLSGERGEDEGWGGGDGF